MSQNKKFNPSDFGIQFDKISNKQNDMYKQAFPSLGVAFEARKIEEEVEVEEPVDYENLDDIMQPSKAKVDNSKIQTGFGA